MEWYIMNATGVRGLTSSLVTKISEENYKINDECEEAIDEILERLEHDDPHTRVTQRHLLTERIVTADLVPIIKFTHPDVNELQAVLRLLTVLSEPAEEDAATGRTISDAVRGDMHALQRQVKNAFLDVQFSGRLFRHLLELMEESGEGEMSAEGYDIIYSSLSLIRNILYYNSSEERIRQLALHGLLLKQGLSSLLLFSIKCHRRDVMAVPVAQILSLLFESFQWSAAYLPDHPQMTPEEQGARLIIDDQLKRLCVSLLQGPLSSLLMSLKTHELDSSRTCGNNYMSWCMGFFLPLLGFTSIEFNRIKDIISCNFVGFLVYRLSIISLNLFSQRIEVDKYEEKSVLLMLSALEAILSTALNYKLSSLNEDELKHLMQFYKDIVQMTDLWQTVLFYIRNFEIIQFPRSVLAQLVSLNHNLLTITELYKEMSKTELGDILLSHIEQFLTPQMIKQYTLLVETYSTNTPHTNMAVFTMLTHICVDCKRVESLYNPLLLKCLGNLSSCENCTEEDQELASYVTQRFLEDLTRRPEVCVSNFINSTMDNSADAGGNSEMDTGEASEGTKSDNEDWTEEEESDLFSVYADVDSSNMAVSELVDNITCGLSQLGIQRSSNDVLSKLELCGLVRSEEKTQNVLEVNHSLSDIVRQCDDDFVTWVHKALVTASYVKAIPKDKTSKLSPICRYSVLREHEIPLIAYSEKLEQKIRFDSHARKLIDALGFATYESTALIPHERSAGQLFCLAEKLKPITDIPNELSYTTHSSGTSSSGSSEDMSVMGEGESKFSSDMPGANSRQPRFSTVGDANIWLNYVRMQK